jgi:hypothetical protein
LFVHLFIYGWNSGPQGFTFAKQKVNFYLKEKEDNYKKKKKGVHVGAYVIPKQNWVMC